MDGDWAVAAGLFARFFGVCGAVAGTRGGDGGVALSRRGLWVTAFGGDSGSTGADRVL